MPDDALDRLFSELAAAELPVPAPATVVARGRQRRQRARRIVLSAVAAVAMIVVAGASQLAGSPLRTQEATGHGSSALAVCTAQPTAGLALEMRHVLALSSQRAVAPIAVSPDGTAVYVQTTTRGFRGIAEESLATGAILTKIAALPPGYEGAQGGLGPGGELVWTSTYSSYGGEGFAYTPMQAWSPRTGRTVALEPAGQHGDAMGAPVFLNHAIAAWEQADGGKQEIVEANLATGSTDVIASGYLGPPVFVGSALVWAVAHHANGPASHLVARNAGVFPARQQIAVPLQLRAAGRATLMGSSSQGSWPTLIGLIASSGPAAAYFSRDLTQLFYSPSPSQPAKLVLRLHGGNTFTPELAVGDGYLGWTVNGDASYLASTTSLAAARITVVGSVVGAGSDYVFVGDQPASKSSQQREFHLFRAATVSALRCAWRTSH
ncbi:MAG TPA: hypothetical protein VGH96_17085 [Streptosporangiaceae bacterium]|jgi:hypothetical protein